MTLLQYRYGTFPSPLALLCLPPLPPTPTTCLTADNHWSFLHFYAFIVSCMLYEWNHAACMASPHSAPIGVGRWASLLPELWCPVRSQLAPQRGPYYCSGGSDSPLGPHWNPPAGWGRSASYYSPHGSRTDSRMGVWVSGLGVAWLAPGCAKNPNCLLGIVWQHPGGVGSRCCSAGEHV